jgi:hypothetical protein
MDEGRAGLPSLPPGLRLMGSKDFKYSFSLFRRSFSVSFSDAARMLLAARPEKHG